MVCKSERDAIVSKELLQRDAHSYMTDIFFFFPIFP